MFAAVFSDKVKVGGGYSGSFIFTPKSVRVIAREALHATVAIQVNRGFGFAEQHYNDWILTLRSG